MKRFKKGQKVRHSKYGECFYAGGTAFGEAIIEIYRNGKFVDRLPVKFEDLANI